MYPNFYKIFVSHTSIYTQYGYHTCTYATYISRYLNRMASKLSIRQIPFYPHRERVSDIAKLTGCRHNVKLISYDETD